ncbi:PREDICTED: SCAN domain-containing protein 3-like, partial [Vollenhovia emeryi]|uniref:SCAN domain-containing protein 3-like n=1 Tax=Vollenhovia emeryi TaxID=411798 RepID=UPI0005F4989D
KAVRASYATSHLIAKNSKPFAEGKLIKECLIAAVESFGKSLTLEEVASIPLNNIAVQSRINDIASSLENQLKSLLQSCAFFHCVSMRAPIIGIRTTGSDIFKAVNQTVEKFDIDLSKCSAIVTDGAKAMIGSKNGFFGQLKQRGLKFPVLHCIIHLEALCGKVVKLSTAMQTVTKIIVSPLPIRSDQAAGSTK